MTLSEIKDQYAKEMGWKDFEHLISNTTISTIMLEEIARRYATACCKATQEKCAESAEVYSVPGYMFRQEVKRESILSPDNIVIL